MTLIQYELHIMLFSYDTITVSKNAPSNYVSLYLAKKKHYHSVGLHTITLQMTGSWQKVKGKQIPWHPSEFFFFFFLYCAKNTCVLGSQVRNALFMHEFAWHQLSYRQETLWSPSWEQSLSLSPVWIVHERVRQVGSGLKAEVEGRYLFFVLSICRSAYRS